MSDPAVVITGATGGLGRVVARSLVQAGYRLACLGTNQDRLAALKKELGQPESRIALHVADLRHARAAADAAQAVASTFDEVNGLVHLVGGWSGGKQNAATSAADMHTMLDQHVFTSFHMLNAFLPHLRKAAWGRVVVVSSPSATRPPGMNSAYATAKAAEEALILSAAAEAAGTTVTANIIQVSAIDVQHRGQGTAPEDIAAAIKYLLSAEARRVNGVRLSLVGA